MYKKVIGLHIQAKVFKCNVYIVNSTNSVTNSGNTAIVHLDIL